MKKILLSFSPAYFALVMATGIISLAAKELQLNAVAEGLFYFNLVAYPLCVALLAGRAILAFRPLWTELTSHAKGPLFLAFVPATCLVGNQLVQLREQAGLSQGLWVVALVGFLVLSYAFLMGVSIGENKPSLEKGLTGGWLLLVVATEALAALGAKLVPTWAGPADIGILVTAGAFLAGALLYIILTTLLFYRLTFLPLGEEEVGAAYWISVGASAITVLAGCTLLRTMQDMQALSDLRPFVKGISLLFWAISTWWIPLVAGLRLRNHLRTRPAFAYSPGYWSMVFPLGMYTAATLKLAEALPLPALKAVPTYFIYVALLAWLLALGGMLVHFVSPAKASN